VPAIGMNITPSPRHGNSALRPSNGHVMQEGCRISNVA
jgi:hypothetical protein